MRLKTRVAEADPTVDSLVALYGSAAFMERECHEMYGIGFRGNADLRPILLYEGFVGHPLRKDYPKHGEQPLVPTAPEPPVDTACPTPSARCSARRCATTRSSSTSARRIPATHGTIQIIAELDGEKMLRTDVHCGYLHRGFEKECEDHTWHNLIPYVDRLNYCSALINDFAYCDAVEQLMGIEITPRAATCARCSRSTRASSIT